MSQNPQSTQTNQNLITIKINNHILQCEEGETVLEVARANGIFIPTICYLSGCSPTLACKMCMGENGEGKRVYTCNTKAKDGLEIFTDTPEIQKERQMIMQTYDVNHPLECGVCDKSGECELQNLTLYTKVSHQDFALPDDEKHSKFWAQAEYDPNLCIVCERCATTCKDNIGEAKLKANKAELHSPDEYKDKMEKDPYSVWSKKQKSLIEFVSETPCIDCGECIAVCPVGALTYKDFSYSANAWELKSISSTCTHCAAGCFIIYEKRHCDITGKAKIYRVKNDFHFAPICGAARFGFSLHSKGDFEAKDNTNANEVLNNALNTLKTAKSIQLGSQATNEEALIVQNLATHFGLNIYNNEAWAYKQLLDKLPLNHSLSELKDSSVIIALGSSIRLQIPQLQYAINNTIRLKKGIKFFYVNPIFDSLLASFSRSIQSISYGANCEEEALLSLLLALQESNDFSVKFGEAINTKIATLLQHIQRTRYETKQESKPNTTQESLQNNSQETTTDSNSLDSNAINNAESSKPKIAYKALEQAEINLDDFKNIANALLETISLQNTQESQQAQNQHFCNASLIIGQEVLNAIIRKSSTKKDSINAKSSQKISSAIIDTLAILEYLGVKVFVIPNGTNVAGIARICTLQEPKEDIKYEETIGIRASGQWIWDSFLCDEAKLESSMSHLDSHLPLPHLILPTFSQVNATITNYENRVLPLNRTLYFSGFDLGDIAKFVASIDKDFALNYVVCEHLQDYALELPAKKGYKNIPHSALKNYYTQSGEDKRGYGLEPINAGFSIECITSGTDVKDSAQETSSNIAFNAYLCFPQNLFNAQTVLDKNMQQQDGFYTSKAYFDELGLQEGQEICLKISQTPNKDIITLKGRAYIDYGLSQNIWLISPYIFAKEVSHDKRYQISSNYLSANLI